MTSRSAPAGEHAHSSVTVLKFRQAWPTPPGMKAIASVDAPAPKFQSEAQGRYVTEGLMSRNLPTIGQVLLDLLRGYTWLAIADRRAARDNKHEHHDNNLKGP